MQILDSFGGRSLKALSRLGLEIYNLIPDYRAACRLCGGAGCAVRHGLYHRRVVDVDGTELAKFPIPRFRCRSRGPRRPTAATFSVLPDRLVPRRRLSLPLMLLILELVRVRRTVPAVLDQLALRDPTGDGALLLDETAVHRIVSLFARSYSRLALSLSHRGLAVAPRPGGVRQRALAFAMLLTEGTEARSGPPGRALLS